MELLLILGFVLLNLALYFSLAYKRVWIIPPLVLEAAGLALVSFYWGVGNVYFGLVLFLVAAFTAVFLDPYIWEKVEKMPADKDSKKLSLVLNGAMGIIVIVFFFAGVLLRDAFK